MFGGAWSSLSRNLLGTLDEAWCLARMVRSYRSIPAPLVETDDGWCTAPRPFATPVVLVHGAAHNGSAWTALSECLRAAGFDRLVALDYRLERGSPDALAVDLGRRLRRVREQAGTDQVHLIGHSLGGLLLRIWHDGMGGADATAAAVTLGAPHRGAPVAALPWTPEGLRCLRPGSRLLQRLDAQPADHSRWTTVTAGRDLLVPDASLPDARNVRIDGIGHTGLLYSREAAGHACFALLAAEEERAATAAA